MRFARTAIPRKKLATACKYICFTLRGRYIAGVCFSQVHEDEERYGYKESFPACVEKRALEGWCPENNKRSQMKIRDA